MKITFKHLVLICFICLGSLTVAQAQISNLNKQATNLQKNGVTNALSNLDQQLISQFKLDNVKSEIVGNILKLKVSDADFSKLSYENQIQQGNQIMDAATKILGGSGINLKNLGVSQMLIQMLPAVNSSNILQAIRRNL